MRVLMISSGALFLVSTGAFFLYVPPLSIATAVLFLVGLTLMFGLGFQAGGQGMVPSEALGACGAADLATGRTIGIDDDRIVRRWRTRLARKLQNR
jgi:hypothetical protein